MKARILLVEDDARIRAAIRLALEHEGRKVQEAASGEQALELFASEPADISRDGRLVDVQVRRLRTKVKPDPANPRHVVTVRGMGDELVP
jgi:DNA-binding response OmpR family regulator